MSELSYSYSEMLELEGSNYGSKANRGSQGSQMKLTNFKANQQMVIEEESNEDNKSSSARSSEQKF